MKNTPIPTNDFDIDDLAENIARELVGREFSHFVSSLGQIQNNSTETTLENLVDTLDNVFNNQFDNGFDPNQIYLPFLLNREVRQRKAAHFQGIDFGVVTLNPTLVKELGNNQIFFANSRCFEKIYPTRIEDQLRIFVRAAVRNPEIDCTITQKLNIRSIQSIAKIVITDIENSEFYHQTVTPS